MRPPSRPEQALHIVQVAVHAALPAIVHHARPHHGPAAVLILHASEACSCTRAVQLTPVGRAMPASDRQGQDPSVMIEKFAGVRGMVRSEFLDLNHTSNSSNLVSLMIPKFARDTGGKVRRTSESGH